MRTRSLALVIALLSGAMPHGARSQDMEPIHISDVTVAPFAGDPSAFGRRRTALGLGDGAAVMTDAIADATLIVAIESLIDEGYGDGERWLFASAARDGQIEVAAWRLWDVALQTSDHALRRARLVRALHFTSGSPAAMLPDSCWSGDELLIASQEPARRAIQALGPGRLRSAFDAAVSGLDAADAATRAALDGLDGRIDVAPPVADACSPALVATVAAAAGEAGDFGDLMPLLAGVLRTGVVPGAVVRRIALHRYLAEDADSLAAIADALAVGSPDWTVEAMRAGLARDGVAMTELATGRPGADVVEVFMLAESHRLSGRYDEALPIYDQLVEQDGLLAAAVFGRAATLIALGREDDALADLAHARLAFADVPIYAPWVEALAARLAR